MPTTKATFIKGDRVSSKTDYRDALPVNMVAVDREIHGAAGYMINYPGLTLLANGLGADRGALYNERFGENYRISGDNFVRLESDDTVTYLGSVPGLSQASMPYSFNTQAVVADGKMFLYDVLNGFREVTDPDLGNPLDCVWIDGYYFLTDGEYIYHTDIADESSIDPLKFATAEFMPDKSLGLAKTQDNKVMVFGRYTTEYFTDAATENFAFQRQSSRALNYGIVATHAKCEAAGTHYITGGGKNESIGVYTIGLGSVSKVSSREVDKLLSAYTEAELADMRMESRFEDDIYYVIVHLPNETLCLNISLLATKGKSIAWSILKSSQNNDDTPYRAINGVFDPTRNKWLYGDKIDGSIGILDGSVCTQYGVLTELILYTPFIHLESQSIDELEIETIPGHTGTEQASVAFSFTTDGITYSQEYWEMYGEPLDYNKRFVIRRVGYISDWVGFKFRAKTAARMAFGVLKITHG